MRSLDHGKVNTIIRESGILKHLDQYHQAQQLLNEARWQIQDWALQNPREAIDIGLLRLDVSNCPAMRMVR